MQHRNVVRSAWTRPFVHPNTAPQCIVPRRQVQSQRKLRGSEIEHLNEHRRRVAQVQDEDQHLLKVLKNRLDNITQTVKRVQVQVEEAAPHASSASATVHDRDGNDYAIPRYTVRKRRIDLPGGFSSLAHKAVREAEQLELHLQDLQLEPYPDRSRSELTMWAAEMRQWSDERKHEELEELRLQEEADRKRLNENTRNLVTFMKGLIAAGTRAKARHDRPQEAAVVFQEVPAVEGKGGRRRPQFKRVKPNPENASDERTAVEAKAEKAKAAPKQSSLDTGGLLEMHSRLTSAIRSGSQR